jgi:hypothetical protein
VGVSVGVGVGVGVCVCVCVGVQTHWCDLRRYDPGWWAVLQTSEVGGLRLDKIASTLRLQKEGAEALEAARQAGQLGSP